MKIYTRTGDSGETALFGGGRVSKTHPRVEAYGDVDEANCSLGVAISTLTRDGLMDMVYRLRSVQEDLFAVGAHLATPGSDERTGAASHLPALPIERILEMETWMDEAEIVLDPLRTFVLPGGTEAAAQLHLARTVCRRAERRVIALAGASDVDRGIIAYLNRLSDLLFVYARLANRRAGAADIPWIGRPVAQSDDRKTNREPGD